MFNFQPMMKDSKSLFSQTEFILSCLLSPQVSQNAVGTLIVPFIVVAFFHT